MTQPTFSLVQGASLSPHQRAEVAGLCSRAYEEDFEPVMQTFADPTHVLAYVDGVLVSHALWVTRWLEYDHTLMLRTAYVEAVATDPGYQRQGFATAVMRALQASLLEFDLGGLSPSEHGWYARLGWEQWHGPLSIRTPAGLLPTPDEEVMILRLPRTPALNPTSPLSAEWRPGELW